MIINLADTFVYGIECSRDESDFIHEELNKLNDDDFVEGEERTLYQNIKIQYAKDIQGRLQREPGKKVKFEEDLKAVLQGEYNNKIQKVKNEINLYRMEIDGPVYSSMIIFSTDKDMIKVRKQTTNFVHRTAEIENRFAQIEATYPRILSTTESINYIVANRCSLSRFGDGELNLSYGLDIGFQKCSLELQNRLREILNQGTNNKILVTLPEFNSRYNNIINCCGQISFWESYWLKMYDNLKDFFVQPFYGNTDVSRNSVFFENSLAEIIKLWDQRDVVFVIGKNGRFEIKSELFDNVNTSEIIYVPPVNAFDTYPQIIESCLKMQKDKLFLISAGPTATVLAYDLMKYGYQALDIGHLPNCYDQYLGRIKYPESIPMVRPETDSSRS